jgi:hypothetical protein
MLRLLLTTRLRFLNRLPLTSQQMQTSTLIVVQIRTNQADSENDDDDRTIAGEHRHAFLTHHTSISRRNIRHTLLTPATPDLLRHTALRLLLRQIITLLSLSRLPLFTAAPILI